MKKIIIAVLVTGLIVLGLFLALRGSSDSTPTATKQQWSDIQNELQQGAKLYDVRTPAEFADGHAENAINLDSEIVLSGTSPDVNKKTRIYLYCRSGNRANQVKAALESRGFSDINSLGGLSDIEALGAKLQQ